MLNVSTEFIIFIRQLGLALAGASALWSLVFLYKNIKGHGGENACAIYDWVTSQLMLPLLFGVGLALSAWGFLVNMLPAHAHEGIVLKPLSDMVNAGLSLSFEIYVIFGLVFVWGLWRHISGGWASRERGIFLMVVLVLSALLMAFGTWTGELLSKAQWFFIGHSTHSIITLGTVLVLDVLFLISRNSQVLKQHIYPLFPTLSKVILVGLGIDFLSVGLVFADAIELSSKFFFMQTVVVVLVLNGMLLAGPITRRLVTSVMEGGHKMTKKWERIANVAGAVSVSSWLGNTFIDSFSYVPFSYTQLLGMYVGLILLLLLAHKALEKFDAAHLHKVKA